MRREFLVAWAILTIAGAMMIMIFFGDPDSDDLTTIIRTREAAGHLHQGDTSSTGTRHSY